MSALGGPGVACSAMRVRRLEAGELDGAERERVLAHVAACGRCQATRAELALERARLEASLPFETFAAGMAERLARPEPVPRRPWRRIVPFAIAAGLALALAAPAVLRRPGAGRGEDTVDGAGSGERSKGGPVLTIWTAAGAAGGAGGVDAGPRPLAPGEPVPAGAALRVEISGAGRRQAVLVLLDEDGAALLHAGDAGLAPGSFEWTGKRGALVAVVHDDGDLPAADLPRFLERLRAGGQAAAAAFAVEHPGAVVLVAPLRRGGGR